MRKNILSFLIGLIFATALSAQVIGTHPRILLGPGIITTLQNRAIANTTEWQEIEIRLAAIGGMNSVQIMNVVYEGQHYCFYHALNFYATGDTASRDSAVSLFEEYFYNYTTDSSMYWDSGYESRSTLVDVAILYDWLYNYMTPTFRNDVRARLIYWGDFILYQPSVYGQFNTPEFFEGNNYCMGHLAGIATTGYSIQSEDALHGDRFIEVADSVMPIMMNFVNTRLHNGDANEGWGYGAGYALSFFKTMSVIKTATVAHTNLYTTTNYDEEVMTFLPYATLPNTTHMLAEGDWARESTGEIWDYHRIVSDIISSYSNDVNTQNIARFWSNETVPINTFDVTAYRWYPFLFSNQEITGINYRTVAPYTDLTLYTDTTGTDQLIQRTGWNSASQWISYRGGGRYGDHAHNGAGHFSIYERGWLMIDKNIQSASGIEGMDSVHNVTQVESMNNIEMYPFASNDYNLAEHTFQKRTEITPTYTYFWSNTAPIYLERENYNVGELNVIEQKERQFFYLPGLRKMAIFDVIESETSGENKWYVSHFWDDPTLGSTNDYVQYSNATTTIYETTCYPINPVINIYDNTVITNNSVAQSKDYFMHLIHTQPVATPQINIQGLSTDAANVQYSNFYGSFHEENATENYAILFNGNDPSYAFDSVAYTVPVTTPQLNSYLLGVSPGVDYYVRYELLPLAIKVIVSDFNTPGSVTHTASIHGVLYFPLGPLPVGINENEGFYANVFYNNYSSSIIINTIDEMGEVDVYVTNQLGEILEQNHLVVDKQLSIQTGRLASGIYVINLQTKKGSISEKVLVIN